MFLWGCLACSTDQGAKLRFGISFPDGLASEAIDGRLLLMISNDSSREPRFQISNGLDTQLVFGIDVEDWKPGETAVVDGGVFGYPLTGIGDIPPGTYQVQALVNRYETFHLSDGRVLKLPPDKGEGQKWNLKPGNLYSAPREVRIDPSERHDDRPFPRSRDPSHFRARGYEIHQACQDREQAPFGVLGPAHHVGSTRAVAGGIRRTSGSPLSLVHFSRAFPE